MDEATVWETLTRVFQDTFEDDEITISPETTAADIEDWDSLTHIQLMVAIERVFKMRFNTGEVASLANVGELVALVIQRSP